MITNAEIEEHLASCPEGDACHVRLSLAKALAIAKPDRVLEVVSLLMDLASEKEDLIAARNEAEQNGTFLAVLIGRDARGEGVTLSTKELEAAAEKMVLLESLDDGIRLMIAVDHFISTSLLN